MDATKVLLVDDEPLLGTPLKRALESNGYMVRLAETGAEALEAMDEERYDILLEDLRLPDADGLEIMKEALRRNAHCSAVVITGHGTIERAVEAMKYGAVDVITKPFPLEALFSKLKSCMDLKQLEQELHQPLADFSGSRRLLGHSPGMVDILNKAKRVAANDCTVLVTGESGTGKELLANFIHHQSHRKAKPWIQVNCAAIPLTLFEGELFGVEQGAYTDAHCSRPGYLQSAHGGTLFLDEVAELPLGVQPKLLRALDEKLIYRVGGSKPIQVDFRLIAATNRDLHQMVREGTFRNDLFFRLNVVPLTVPPLRERKEDLPILIAHFQRRFQSRETPGIVISAEALESLHDYYYPGNVRELKNIIEHLCTIYPGETIKKRHLMVAMHDSRLAGRVFETFAIGKPLKEAVIEFEKKYIRKVMESVGGHKARCANILGMSRKVLWERIKKTGG
jgi:DNA-binding NtrC family response regulator